MRPLRTSILLQQALLCLPEHRAAEVAGYSSGQELPLHPFQAFGSSDENRSDPAMHPVFSIPYRLDKGVP